MIQSHRPLALLPGIVYLACCSVSSAADKATSGAFDADGVNIFYQVAGEGSPVILIHGLAASGDMNWIWPGVMGELAKNHRVVAIDLPGHGRSDKPTRADAYGKQVVEDIVLLMDHLKIDKAHIVGYSAGGMITMRLMVDHPERVISGTVAGMGWLEDGGRLNKFWGGRSENRKKSAGFIQGIPEFSLTKAELENIKVPVKVIIGDQDPCKGWYVDPLRKVRPDWPVVEIKNAGHLNCVIKPEFKTEIVEWLKKND